jgi:hypothetical protein
MEGLLWLAVKKGSWRRFVYWLKTRCDLYLYGEIVLPRRHCVQCGQAICLGDKVTSGNHSVCVEGV